MLGDAEVSPRFVKSAVPQFEPFVTEIFEPVALFTLVKLLPPKRNIPIVVDLDDTIKI